MKTIEPSAVWQQPWLGPCCAVADFNGDGRNELFCLQTAGAHANSFLDPRLNPGAGYKTGVEDQELFCMTLADSRGGVLWQVGRPWALERPYSWNGNNNQFCELSDIDGDGRSEIVFVHKGELRVHDGRTGALRAAKKMPHEGFLLPRVIRTDHSGRQHIFIKSVTDSFSHSYGNPSLLLDHRLNVVWEKDNIPGAGHRAGFADVDGDGLDEMLIGFGLYDHDGTRLWAHEPMSSEDHLDDFAIADLDGDGQMEFAMAHDGHAATVHNLDGTERFRVDMHHCQTIQAGKFFTREPGLQLLLTDKAMGPAREREAIVVRHDGRILSRHRTLGYYTPVGWSNSQGPLSLVRCERPENLFGEFRVVLADPLGNELGRFNVRSDFSDHVRRYGLDKIHPEYPAYLGAGHCAGVGDIDGDGQEEVLISDRTTLSIFRREGAAC